MDGSIPGIGMGGNMGAPAPVAPVTMPINTTLGTSPQTGIGTAALLGAAASTPSNNNPLSPQVSPPASSTLPFNNPPPLQAAQSNSMPDQFSGTPFSQAATPAVMAQIQHPQFQSFLQSLKGQS